MRPPWYVIAGGPCSGKSKIIERLAFLGFAVRTEAARILIDQEMSCGRTLAEIRHDEAAFQRAVLQLKQEAEARTPRDQVVFWDRGIPDSLVYLEACGADTKNAREACLHLQYRKVFFCEPLPVYHTDQVRL